MSGTCWSTSTAHTLSRSYAEQAAAFDLIDDGVAIEGAHGWACEWSQNASATNQHIAMALCCDDRFAAHCAP